LFRAISLIQQATTVHFLRLTDEKRREREEQLRASSRAVSHEIKNQIGTVVSASETLQAVAAREAARQLREHSRAANVEIRLESLREVEVNAAAVELCLTNYLSNAIKYADPKRANRYAVVSGSIGPAQHGGREVVVRVRDNGLGVAREKRGNLFERFYRAHETPTTQAEGTGLGLSIVSETVASLGGRAWAEFPSSGSVFAFSLPYRRHQSSDRNTQASVRDN
jgi:K+-sensing histidine kinase KdpD